MNWEKVAESAYKAYCNNLFGSKYFEWKRLGPQEKIAWQAAVQQVVIVLDADKHPKNRYDSDESKWKGWKPGLGWYGEQPVESSLD
jgi:hypothetical protein